MSRKKLITCLDLGIPPPEKTKQAIKAKFLKVLNAWICDDLDTFCDNLDSNILNYTYSKKNHLRLLDILVIDSSSKSDIKFLEEALAHCSNINEVNPITKKTTAHYAIEHENFNAINLLIEKGADPNIQDNQGNTILHLIVTKCNDFQEFHQLLLNLLLNKKIIVNIPNLEGYTPIFLAAVQGNESIVTEFLRSDLEIDVDTFENVDGKTCRSIVNGSFPSIRQYLPEIWQPNPKNGIIDYQYRLFYHLSKSQEDQFCKIFKHALQNSVDVKPLFNCVDGGCHTLLQRAVEKGCIIVFRILLKNGADINYKPATTDPPIFLAALHSSLTIFGQLLAHKNLKIEVNTKDETLLHVLVNHRGQTFVRNTTLRKLIRHPSIDINAQDNTGQTALHLAVTNADEKTIFILLDNGARLDIKNNIGETAFSHLSPTTYKNYLNTKISSNYKESQNLSYTIFFSYKFMASKSGTKHIHDINTEVLRNISKSKEHRQLLAHPLIATIIYFKWQRIRYLFYLYLFLACLFCILFTTFIYLASCDTLNCTKYFSTLNETYKLIVEIYLWIYLVIRGGCEIIDLFYNPLQYFKSVENYLEVGMVTFCFVSLQMGCPRNPQQWDHCRLFSAYAVLFVWFELFFVLGESPDFNFFIGMFRTATWFFLQFLFVHTSLLLAFVFSFCVLFQDENGAFESIPKSLFKILVMVTGEYELDDIPFDSMPITSHILFIFFLFLVAIVLFNLLTGLAVSATRPIEDDTFLYSCCAQVPIIAFIENLVFDDSHLIKRAWARLFKKEKTKQTKKTYPVLLIYPNQKNKQMKIHVEYEQDGTSSRNEDKEIIKVSYELSKRIIQDAQQTITTKLQESNIVEEKIDKLQMQLEATREALEEELKTIKNILSEHTGKWL